MIKKAPFKRLYEGITKKDNGCWEWNGATGSSGYGNIKAFGRMVSCHVLSYELYYGAIPKGNEVMHSCDNRICVNPDHLSCGTHKQNMMDASKRKAWSRVVRKGVRGINKSQSKQVMVIGKPYGSINEAEKALGLGNGTVTYWLKTNNPKAKVITKDEYLELIE